MSDSPPPLPVDPPPPPLPPHAAAVAATVGAVVASELKHPWLDVALLRAFDSETLKFSAGCLAPPVVCASTAEFVDGQVRGKFIQNAKAAREIFRYYLENGFVIVLANAAYDLAVMAQADETLLPLIFAALREGRIYDILPAQALDAIAGGHIGYMPNGSPLVNPSTGKMTTRYSLPMVALLTLGRADVKDNDVWRESYALLEDVPRELWPEKAKQYPVDDSVFTLEIAIAQIFGQPGKHEWVTIPSLEGKPAVDACKFCGEVLTYSAPPPRCDKAPRIEPHRNLDNLAAQLEAAFALHLGACHGLRTDPERVAKLEAEVEEKHRVAVERFQKKGWIREDGTEDQAAVKRALAIAYGAKDPCKRCGGAGRLKPPKMVECRGEKVRGRYQKCQGDNCGTCGGSKTVQVLGNEVTCKNVFDEANVLQEVGCDGSGFDLSTVPLLPRTEKLGVGTDRDAKMESGDDDMSDYGEDEFEKSRTTYVPWLKKGIDRPLEFRPNVLVATGRCSYEGSPVHQMPRNGHERECIRARGAWCGYPTEMVLGSTDYEAGELCTLAQFNYWLFGYSRMRDVINQTGKPGILHSDLAAEVLGISLEEFLTRLKAKDKTCVDFRQAMKPINFGRGGGMGTPKMVLTNRKRNAGFTKCLGGPARDLNGNEGYWGIRFCILVGGAKACGTHKLMEWKRYPCAPVCSQCCEVVENILNPAYDRRYPEMKDYFKWGGKKVENHQPAPSVVWDEATQSVKLTRVRGGCEYSAFLNNGFQSMLGDIMKAGYVDATRECYLGVKPDNSTSPLAGCRLPLAVHDEPVSELFLDTSHISGPRIADVMVTAAKRFAPDVVWRAETALAFFLSKKMEPVYVNGKLVPWVPEEKKAA